MITLRYWEQDMDLRRLSRGRLFWWAAKRKLREGEAVLITNVKMDRLRIIVVLGGLPWMLSPPVRDSQHTLSYIQDMALDWVASQRGAVSRRVA